MKPLKRHVISPIVFFLFAILGAQKIILPSILKGNIYLIVAWAFVSVAFLFLGICYYTPLFSKKWYRWLYLVASTVFFISITAEIVIIHQMSILKLLTIWHITFFVICMILLFTRKTLLRNKFLWVILMSFIPLAGSIYFLIWHNRQIKQNPGNQ